jgi:hypothetical protein
MDVVGAVAALGGQLVGKYWHGNGSSRRFRATVHDQRYPTATRPHSRTLNNADSLQRHDMRRSSLLFVATPQPQPNASTERLVEATNEPPISAWR